MSTDSYTLDNLEPKKVFEYFKLLSSVPHGSGNTKAISDICVDFACEHGLEYYRDDMNNVIIYAPASTGFEDAPTLILQGHLDMVCAKTDDNPIDMEKEPITLVADGEFLHAADTSLGGDNAIAVAVIMALLDDRTLAHPALEAVFTVDEETGMYGADALDCSRLRGRRLLNLDSEEEGVFTAGCAGGLRLNGDLPATFVNVPASFLPCELTVSGLLGGHSGVDIHRNRANSNKLMGTVLKRISDEVSDFRLFSCDGGMFDNVIPQLTKAVIYVSPADYAEVQSVIARCLDEFRNIYSDSDPDISIEMKPFAASDASVIIPSACDAAASDASVIAPSACDAAASAAIAGLIDELPWSVQSMSPDIPGLVQTSLNPGIMKLDETGFHISFSLRSSVSAEKDALTLKVSDILKSYGAAASTHGDYPAWEYLKESPLREICLDVYKKQTGKDPVVTVIHAGLECGLFSRKIQGLDCISFGPDLRDVHSVRERLNIPSVARMYEFVREVLRRNR